MENGTVVETRIRDVAFGGKGVGELDKMVVFVPGVTTGERVRVRITSVRKRFAEAELVEILEPSPDRVEAPCPLYGRCGGCQYQHLSYSAQVAIKEKQVKDAFLRIAHIPEPPVSGIVEAPQSYGYRNKLVMHGPGQPSFYTVPPRERIPVERCLLAKDEINDMLFKTPPLTRGEDEVTYRVTTAGETWCSLTGERNDKLVETLCGIPFQVAAASFHQVNIAMAEQIAQHVSGIVEACAPDTLFDFYCGAGLLALTSASHAGRVVGLEADRRAVKAARRTAERQGIANSTFEIGSAEQAADPFLAYAAEDRVCVIVDPPRQGCERGVMDALVARKPSDIIHVSCNPPKLARDVRTLVDAGYDLRDVRAFDMFPQTSHIEAVAHLTRRDS